ncbi:uncharacterized protein ColSpa_11244 [Colletotrichum spaethianum]|uniref:Uncharacterized protein n=1 Tax=Colletotrichum spaethianum TaxID=700344 RepID=A0AA37UT20_9PEZI|nr:uncharacterized protein ColSpa_11244 [Colletotrichum spaethianum]GKT51063.1 hypothetical protein ColSpa_11244 [Colletotrichum spaethianum]
MTCSPRSSAPSASIVVACVEADKQRPRMRRLAASRGWHREAAYTVGGGGEEDEDNNKKGAAGVSSSTDTVVVHVARTLFTTDMAAEASALRAESAERLAESQSAVAAVKSTATTRPLASRELDAAAAARSRAASTTTMTTPAD